jgi:hypothetical protein
MTVVNVFYSSRVVYIATDGLNIGLDKTYLAPKIYTAVHMPKVIAVRGLAGAAYQYGTMLNCLFDDFDQLVSGIESEFRNIHANFLRLAVDREWNACNGQLTIAGWSAERQRCEVFLIRGGDDDPDVYPPWQLISLEDGTLLCAPPPSEEVEFHPARIEQDMVSLMEVQRRGQPRVGGFCELATLTRDGIVHKILKRWDWDASQTWQPGEHRVALEVARKVAAYRTLMLESGSSRSTSAMISRSASLQLGCRTWNVDGGLHGLVAEPVQGFLAGVSDIGRVFNRNPPPIFLLEATFRPAECLIDPAFYLPRGYYLSAAKGLGGQLGCVLVNAPYPK